MNYTCVTQDEGAIPAASIFSELASTSDTPRHLRSKDDTTKDVATHHAAGDSRQQAVSSDTPRSIGATKSATRLLAQYPDLAAVAAAWPDVPEAVRAGVVAMVKAAKV
jgi:hypothetical protein